MKKTIFKGAGVAIVTPFTENNEINYDELTKLLEFQIANGTDAIIVCGTTGESATLSSQERKDVIEHTVKIVNGRIPVIAGSGSNNTEVALKNSLEAESLGVDGLLIVTPYYNKTSQSGLIKHYLHIAEKVSTPIVLYNVPSRTGVNIAPETYSELSKHENIVATKEASGDISHIAKIISLCGENLAIYSGNDDQIIPILSLGGIGVISVLSNLVPRIAHNIVQNYLDGETKKSTELQLKYLELANMLFCDVNPIPIKAAMNLIDCNCGRCRMPLDILSENSHSKLKACMRKYQLI